MRISPAIIAVLLNATLALPAIAADAGPQLVLLVRHAERATEPASDPALTEAGENRAQALALALQYAGITAIITSNYRRTRETAAPIARQLGLTPEVIPARKGELAAHIEEVRAAVRRQSGTVLVVGHSNTLAAIIHALGGPAMPELCETSYGHAFVLRPGAGLLRLRYGAIDPAPSTDCQ